MGREAALGRGWLGRAPVVLARRSRYPSRPIQRCTNDHSPSETTRVIHHVHHEAIPVTGLNHARDAECSIGAFPNVFRRPARRTGVDTTSVVLSDSDASQ